jgi:hypothetical protein
VLRWFGKIRESDEGSSAQIHSAERFPRHSGAWALLRRRLLSEPGLRIVDTGCTSPANINYLTGLGHSVFIADLVADACTQDWRTGTDEEGNSQWNIEGYLNQSLNFAGRMYDVALLWTSLDYLPEPFVTPVVEHLHASMNPGGQVLAFFHTRTQGEETLRFRYHVTESDDVEMQMTQQFPIQRAFTNRSIERLFAGWSNHHQFLAKDSVSEVIITR